MTSIVKLQYNRLPLPAMSPSRLNTNHTLPHIHHHTASLPFIYDDKSIYMLNASSAINGGMIIHPHDPYELF